MNFAELKTALQALGYGTDSDTVQGLFINEAYRRIARRRAWSWLRSSATAAMVAGKIEYPWADFGLGTDPPRRLESARIIDAAVNPPDVLPLRWLDPPVFTNIRGSLSTTWPTSERDTPEFWTRADSNSGIAVWPPPVAAHMLHLNYIAPVSVLAGTDAPAMPRDYHDAIVYEAAWLMASRQRDQLMMNEMRAERDAVLAELVAEESVAQTNDYERVGGKEIWLGLERRF